MSVAETEERRPPLFYHAPEPLSAEAHQSWRLRDGDAGFAARTPYVPLVVGEFAAAMTRYPIVFAAADASPVAVLGLEQSNLFVADGQWTEGAYVPAYVRRYPFGFIATTEPGRYALAIDTGSDRIVREGEDGASLFEGAEPSALTAQALAFCDAFRNDADQTAEFCSALKAKALLIDRRADATLPDGRKLGLDGFRIVDAQAFARLDAGTIVEWHTKGWLALVHFHLASLERFGDLLARQSARPIAVTQTAPELAREDVGSVVA